MKRSIQDYDKIIDYPHYQSTTRPHMSNYNRAAQFAPFAALTGYDEDVKEAARLTDDRMEHSEMRAEFLNERIRILQERILDRPYVTITYFLPDEKKSGGAYITTAGTLRWIDLYGRFMVFADGSKIPIMDIFDIQGYVFLNDAPDEFEV